MKNNNKTITNPDELNKNLQYSSPIIWIILTSVVFLLLGFFVWSCIYSITLKLTGMASINEGQVTLVIEERSIRKLQVGQKVYIAGQEGEILSIKDDQPVISTFSLQDGDYEYYIVIGEKKPVEFLLGK